MRFKAFLPTVDEGESLPTTLSWSPRNLGHAAEPRCVVEPAHKQRAQEVSLMGACEITTEIVCASWMSITKQCYEDTPTQFLQ